MKTLVDQLAQYADYHRDRRNIATHFVGIPMIVLAVQVLLSRPALQAGAFVLTPALLTTLLACLYYVALDRPLGVLMAALLAAGLRDGGGQVAPAQEGGHDENTVQQRAVIARKQQRAVSAERNAGQPDAHVAGRARRPHHFMEQAFDDQAAVVVANVRIGQQQIERQAALAHRLHEAFAHEVLRRVVGAGQQHQQRFGAARRVGGFAQAIHARGHRAGDGCATGQGPGQGGGAQRPRHAAARDDRRAREGGHTGLRARYSEKMPSST